MNTQTRKLRRQASLFAVLCSLLLAWPVLAAEVDCLMCHPDLAAKKVKHAAVDMGCAGCHTAVDASDVPHKMRNKVPKGLSGEQPELCYGCHDRTLFSKKTVHAAVGMGCTGCHNPHSSDNRKLLAAAVPDLCFTCHDKAEFTRKLVHPPVASGQCLACHDPHATDTASLLKKETTSLCLGCHGGVDKKPHAIKGFGNAGHPLGKKEKKDPKRPEKQFTCTSCHTPHSSDSIRLFRYPASSTMGVCRNCHTY